MEVSLLKDHIIIGNFTEFADQKRRRRGERLERERCQPVEWAVVWPTKRVSYTFISNI